MKVDLALAAVFFACTVLTSSLGHPVLQLPLKSGKRLAKFPSYHNADPFASVLLNPRLPPPVASASDQHFQWWGTGTSPELVQSGWYGFNRFSPRSARNTRGGRKAEYLLGENSYVSMFPQMMFQGNGDQAVLDLIGELQRNIIHPVPHMSAQFVQPRIVMIDQAVGLQPGMLVPVRHPRYHQLFSNGQQPTRTRSHRRRQQSAPVPVTIKVVPLKITSADIANALKSMSFLPFPLALDQNKGDAGANADVAYDDNKGSSNYDDDDDLPPPSSHVAMPVDKDGLGIVYADSRRLEHSIRDSYQPR